MRLAMPLGLSGLALILANLVPLAGVLLGWWSAYEIVLLFWAENIVIGLFQLAKMATVLVLAQRRLALVTMPFFIINYGIFCAGHGFFVVLMLGPSGEPDIAQAIALLLSPSGLLFALLALAASHAFSFVLNFLLGGEWRNAEPDALMKEPYARLAVLHVALIFGGWGTMMLGEPMSLVALLVVIKAGADLASHRRRHAAAQGLNQGLSPGRPAPARAAGRAPRPSRRVP